MINFLLVSIGGSIGACLRFFVYITTKSFLPPNYLFLHTFLVNILGSFFIGYIIMLTGNKSLSNDFTKNFIIIGILGSFTTFSTFSYETVELLINKRFLLAFFYMFLSLFLCLLFTFFGLNLNKLIN